MLQKLVTALLDIQEPHKKLTNIGSFLHEGCTQFNGVWSLKRCSKNKYSWNMAIWIDPIGHKANKYITIQILHKMITKTSELQCVTFLSIFCQCNLHRTFQTIIFGCQGLINTFSSKNTIMLLIVLLIFIKLLTRPISVRNLCVFCSYQC